MSDKTPFPGYPGTASQLRRVQAGKIQGAIPDVTENGEAISALQSQVGEYDPESTGKTITEEIEVIKLPGTVAKANTYASREDVLGERQSNKHLLAPLINDDVAVRASVVVDLGGTTGNLAIYVAIPGSAGNSYSAAFTSIPVPTLPALPSPQSATFEDDVLSVNFWDGNTVMGVLKMIERECPEAFETFVFSYAAEDAGKQVEPFLTTQFSGGVDGHGLQSTAQQLDNLVANAPREGAPVAPVASSNTLTFSAEPAEGDILTIAGKTYRFRRNSLGAGVKAACVLDLTAEAPHDGDFVTLGAITYTFKTALTPTAGEVLIEATSAGCVANLIDAITEGAGKGTKYADGTLPSPLVTVAAVSNTMTVEYATVGVAGNSFATLTGNGVGPMTHGSFHSTKLHDGVDPQAANDVYSGGSAEIAIDNLVTAITTGYSSGVVGTGTTAQTLVTAAKKDADEMTVTATTAGEAGDDIEVDDEGGGSYAFQGSTLTGGVDGTPGLPGAQRYDDTAMYISIGNSTASVSYWKAWNFNEA